MVRQFVVSAVFVGLGLSAHAQSLSDAAVDRAIKAGQDKRFRDMVSECVAVPSSRESLGLGGGVRRTGVYHVTVSSNEGRIALMAARAKRLNQPFDAGKVPDELREPALFVTVEPRAPQSSRRTISIAAIIARVLLRSKAKKKVLEPDYVELAPVEWSNLLTGKFTANRAVASFPLEGARDLPAGGLEVVVMTRSGERRCDVGEKDRRRLFPPNR